MFFQLNLKKLFTQNPVCGYFREIMQGCNLEEVNQLNQNFKTCPFDLQLWYHRTAQNAI